MNRSKIPATGRVITVTFLFALLMTIVSCTKNPVSPAWHYYEVGFKGTAADWRDSSFIVATNNVSLIEAIETQLTLPVAQRKIVTGRLLHGSGGYNKNASHEFKWHFEENHWELTDLSAEIFDGRPYSDVDSDISYWLNTIKRFAPWGSYIKKEIPNGG